MLGDRFAVQDKTDRAMIDAGRPSASQPAIGQTIYTCAKYYEPKCVCIFND
jgi:hypothetical protein